MNSPTVAIELAQASDSAEIMHFVREHWSASHVLGSSKALLDWQHAAGDHYNFVIGRSSDEGIVGVLGFIPFSRYDDDLSGPRETIWLALWKVREEVSSGLGLRLLLHLQKTYPQALIGSVGINPSTRGIYEALGYRTGALTRFALVRTDITTTVLATVPADWNPPKATRGGTVITEVVGSDFLNRTAVLGRNANAFPPFKTRGYIQERYLNHPYYTYRAWLVSEGSRHGVMITRLCTHAGAGALRIVDFVGDPLVLAGAGPAFERLLHSSGAEYLDFFAAGLSSELTAAGLFDATRVPGLLLPGHFEPFDRRNVELLYCLRGSRERAIVCKGDGDQDRPNRLPVNT